MLLIVAAATLAVCFSAGAVIIKSDGLQIRTPENFSIKVVDTDHPNLKPLIIGPNDTSDIVRNKEDWEGNNKEVSLCKLNSAQIAAVEKQEKLRGELPGLFGALKTKDFVDLWDIQPWPEEVDSREYFDKVGIDHAEEKKIMKEVTQLILDGNPHCNSDSLPHLKLSLRVTHHLLWKESYDVNIHGDNWQVLENSKNLNRVRYGASGPVVSLKQDGLITITD